MVGYSLVGLKRGCGKRRMPSGERRVRLQTCFGYVSVAPALLPVPNREPSEKFPCVWFPRLSDKEFARRFLELTFE
jgi:hypothetical protein